MYLYFNWTNQHMPFHLLHPNSLQGLLHGEFCVCLFLLTGLLKAHESAKTNMMQVFLILKVSVPKLNGLFLGPCCTLTLSSVKICLIVFG